MAQSRLKPGKPILTIPSTANEWRRSSAYYTRVIVPHSVGLARPSGGFRHSRQGVIASWGAHGLSCSNYLRREFLDVGDVANQTELGELYSLTYVFFHFI